MGLNAEFWRGRRVLVTGHTGFKGSWLCLLLHQLGAEVHGLALDPETPALFSAAAIDGILAGDHRVDVRDRMGVGKVFREADPEVCFHLAAQALVRRAYREPVETFAVNVQGSVHVLEAMGQASRLRAGILVTTDKVYENHEQGQTYREHDPLGGHDPYSASKAAMEVVIASWRSSFCASQGPALASVRAGNVIGGGDWGEDRLLPDCVRAFADGRALCLRRPKSVRPWQHVLEPVHVYVSLAEKLAGDQGQQWAEAWNVGPEAVDEATVGEVAARVARQWGGGARIDLSVQSDAGPHEAGILRLDSSKVRARLGWRPRWRLDRAVSETVEWYRRQRAGEAAQALCLEQIRAYAATAVT